MDKEIRQTCHLPNAIAYLEEIVKNSAEGEIALFLDFDGTLAEIMPRPEMAVMADGLHEIIKALGSQILVTIVSGRDREDIVQRAGIGNLRYAGSHGFDISGPDGLRYEYEDGLQSIPRIEACGRELYERLARENGVQVEVKRFAIAVHYRNVAPGRENYVAEIVREVVDKFPSLKLSGGKKVWELKPRLDWNKGKAVIWLQKLFEKDAGKRYYPVYVGDDITDEDAFSAIKGNGTGILVGTHGQPTAANYSLPDVTSVGEFLRKLSEKV